MASDPFGVPVDGLLQLGATGILAASIFYMIKTLIPAMNKRTDEVTDRIIDDLKNDRKAFLEHMQEMSQQSRRWQTEVVDQLQVLSKSVQRMAVAIAITRTANEGNPEQTLRDIDAIVNGVKGVRQAQNTTKQEDAS